MERVQKQGKTSERAEGKTAAPAHGPVGLKSSLVGMGYEDQVAALAPSTSAAADVQRRVHGASSETDASQIQSLAQSGLQGGGGALPAHADVQASFGRHDISDIRAHSGGAASAASQAMGAAGYATGRDVVFADASPTLHTQAHEAAHVVQQRAGVQLSGGVGSVGDRYERHADAVADAVVAGRSAEPLLDQTLGGQGHSAVQRAVFAAGDASAVAVPQDAQDIAAAIMGGSVTYKNNVKGNLGGFEYGGADYVGGRPFQNRPMPDATTLPGSGYKEYDVTPYVAGQNRGTNRVVIGNGKAYYTNDHYDNFTEIA